MKNELNYLSKKIQGLEDNILELEMALEKKNGVGGRIGESYKQQVIEMKTEKTILENILTDLQKLNFILKN